MPFDIKAVPFEIPTVNQGLRVAKGLIKLEGEVILLEFRVRDAFLGIISTGVREARIPLAELQSVDFKKGWFSSRIILDARSIRVFDSIPGTRQAECVLKIKQKNRSEAEKLISNIRLKISEMKLRDMEE